MTNNFSCSGDNAEAALKDTLPLVLAGPIIRRATADSLTIWLAVSKPLNGYFEVWVENEGYGKQTLLKVDLAMGQHIQVGRHAWIYQLTASHSCPIDTPLNYDVVTQQGSLTALMPYLCYPGQSHLNIVIRTKADYVMHGSCRNPHYPSKDSLVAADNKVAGQAYHERPSLLMMSGDQIYADHVAGPMLDAIQQVIDLLGLYGEQFDDAPVADSEALYQHADNFYYRDKLLPHYMEGGEEVIEQFPKFAAWLRRRSPVFSSRESGNHLITFAEFMAMYIMVWSPSLWEIVDSGRLAKQHFRVAGRAIEPTWQQRWAEEKIEIDNFVAGLPQVQRLMAHIPTYMIFDDHDITDDWNLTVGWERAAYGNPFSRRIIGNGLIAYWLCQGWGNAPEHFGDEFHHKASTFFSDPQSATQDDFIDYLYRFEQWHYTIPTTPKMVVLDTRTRRWRSESKMNKPSGLMDWEALMEFQHELLHEPAVIIVSAAPMFGVKFIETLQKMMTWLGQPLLIDAENWMAHPGSANTLISIFTHTKTPTNFVILSGDVHYSFAYDVKLRVRKCKPNIFQITSSGIKNEFPNGLLRVCDFMDRILYSPRSPLNWLTKRKRLKILKRDPDLLNNHRLVNRSAIGEVRLDPDGRPMEIAILTAEGDRVSFPAA
ncbi:isoleucyl-tRNA synthetase [Photobacterium aquae]|uniref:Isoleucyl-tRNA synthetase n=1 Tax=Photobacterium aquae TaxID=1195763 RepID=A0A0J1GZR1_9GAMM|nr:alkaline phosphatase D family protein [Photobacterium aquae]KLV05108.1 isoleucyl-tRNA synthetase [Photobacterium aquae]